MAKKIPIDTQELAVNVLRQVDGMRRDKKHCDFLIKVGSEEIPAHRNILSATSDYFGAMFTHPTVENKSGVVEMMGVDPECAIICVDHMYGKEISILPDKYEPLIYVAKLMQLQKLPDAVLSLVESNLDPKSFYTARRIASMYGCKNLEQKCEEFAEENFGLISEEEEFGDLDESYIKKVMRSENVKIPEEEKLCGLLKWTKYHSERSESLARLVKCVDLSNVPVEYRRYLVENDPLVSESPELFRSFSISMLDTMNVGSRDALVGANRRTNSAIVIFDRISGYLQRFNPSDNSWKQMQEMNEDMKGCEFSAVTVCDHIYVLMINQRVYRLRYSDEENDWERRADMIVKHHSPLPATVLNGKIYAFAGKPDYKAISKYDSETDQWEKLGNQSLSVFAPGVLTSQGYIYIFGGKINGNWSNKAVRFDPASATWTDLAPMTEAKAYVRGTVMDDKIYLLGSEGILHSRKVEVYDIKDNCWNTLKPMNVARSFLRGFTIDGCIYAVGGRNSSPDSIEKYDFKEDEWKMVEIPHGMKLKIFESVQIKIP